MAETPHQQLNVYAPTTLDIYVNEPRIAPERAAPANLLRLWFPESLQAYDAGNNLLWEHTFEAQPSWRYVNESMGDMKGGRAVRKSLRSVETVDGLALIDCSVRWRGVDIDLDLTITNTGPMAWARVITSTCLQRPAAPDYLGRGRHPHLALQRRGVRVRSRAGLSAAARLPLRLGP